METEKSMLWIVAIVAVVAIVAMVMIMNNGGAQQYAPVSFRADAAANAGGQATAISPNLYGCKSTGWICYSIPDANQQQQKGYYWSCQSGTYKCVINGEIAY